MLHAALLGLLAAGTLVLGALVALVVRVPERTTGLVYGIGAGALLSAVSFELVDEAFADGGTRVLVAGMLAGCVTFLVGSRLLERSTGARRTDDAQARAIVFGAVLDGIPESLVIGAGAASGVGAPVAFVAAVALSNVPESLGATAQLRAAGHGPARTLATWVAIALVSALAAAAGYAIVHGSGAGFESAFQAFAAGAVLTMLTDSMIPEAYRLGGRFTGAMAVLGFAIAFLLD